MALNNDQSEPRVPMSNNGRRESADLLPKFYRTKSNKKFLQSTLDQLTQPGTVTKVSGYIGRQNAKATNNDDIFLSAADQTRQNYQLEPAAVISDYLGNTTFFKDYIDHINHVSVFDGIVDNHSRINRQEFYSWNPNICWDKFVNYQKYYWLPFGPDTIAVSGKILDADSTYTVKVVNEGDNSAFLITPDGLTRNPTLKLYRGQTYRFNISSRGHPFSIKASKSTGTLDRYSDGVSKQSVSKGTIVFQVPLDSPDVLFYTSDNDIDTGGIFEIYDINENTFLDVSTDIIGKQSYTVPTGVGKGITLSNGMKISFIGKVIPEQYKTGNWYVEGVGKSIRLVSEADLEVLSNYLEDQVLLFDDIPFDQLPFSEVKSFPKTKDYITINRASADGNAWSRYNRWFHQDVIAISATLNGRSPDLLQQSRATRPIIEFNSDIKLYNHGAVKRDNVDLIDNYTTDVFSTIEGSSGYNIDGIDVVDGMKIIFNADTDVLVKNKIYKVKFINVSPPGRKLNFTPATDVSLIDSRITFQNFHGLTNGSRVFYISDDNNSISGLRNRQLYYVKIINSLQIELCYDRTLETKVNLLTAPSGSHQLELFVGSTRRINLIEDANSMPNEYESVSIKFGNRETLGDNLIGNQGQTYWFDGSTWRLSQIKSALNTSPLFDIFDADGNSYADTSVYEGSSFTGCKIFSYKVGTGAIDTELKFPLQYQNINNVGDIVFNFDLLNDSFSFKDGDALTIKQTEIGYIKKTNSLTSYTFENGWVTSNITNAQPIVRIYKNSGLLNRFPIDVIDNIDTITDLSVRVYVNGVRISTSMYQIESVPTNKFIVLTNDILENDILTVKVFTTHPKNENGFYEIPISLQHNPLNDKIEQFTLGQVIDHVDSIIDNYQDASEIPIRDLDNLSSYGTRFVQHSSPLNLALYHFGSKEANLIKAIEKASSDYSKFKRSFIIAATESGIDIDVKRHVDYILFNLLNDRPKSSPYYLSDMFPYSAHEKLTYTVFDARIKSYPLTKVYNPTELSNKAVGIYLNGTQLINGKDYTFGNDEFFKVSAELNESDIIEVYEYQTTDGSFCPPTPTKLGIFPKFYPSKYIDTTYSTPTEVIQGHDGSVAVAFGDYRDDLILELETRIFNNIKVNYDTGIFDINAIIPGYNRKTDYTIDEYTRVLSKNFFRWTTQISQDYTKPDYYNSTDPFTYNFGTNTTPDNNIIPGYWRGIYKWLLDTDRPHTHPWECLGFSMQPSWWVSVYGPAPYTSDNFILWEDLRDGVVREPGSPLVRLEQFIRPILSIGCPVNHAGELVDPRTSGFIIGEYGISERNSFKFGDVSVVENAWRRSSYFPFAFLGSALILNPGYVLGTTFDRSRIVRNICDQLIYSDTQVRIKMADLVLPSTTTRTIGTRSYTCGLINYVIEHLTSENVAKIDRYASDLRNLTNKISTRLGGFTSKPKYKLLLDSKTPNTGGGVFVPEENYNISLSVSSSIKKVNYSGIIITKFASGFEVKGYNFDSPYFTYYGHRRDLRVIRIGGISESFSDWAANKTYTAGKIVQFGNSQFYRSLMTHNSGDEFDSSLYARLPELPIIGGREGILRTGWDSKDVKTIAYGTTFDTIQDVIDFIQGYGVYLESQGFVFDDFNNNSRMVSNWETSIKEFLFWTTQGWGEGAVLSLSPSASRLVFNSALSVVDDINSRFNGYSVFRVDGQALPLEDLSVYRNRSEFILEAENSNYGIYAATLHLVQKEHIAIIDDVTLFNDIIYDKPAGYKQQRIRVLGYVTSQWQGGFDIPGFIYDPATINNWEPWTDYSLGSIVKHKEFYYSAKTVLSGTEKFEDSNWNLLRTKPEAELIPNLDYKVEQFSDFYDLDTDNFDVEQQKIAQHLIGYQSRPYLENIIKNDVSQYKFYQGMIAEKGTTSVLNKLFDASNSSDIASITFDEEWAFRVGEYGSTDTFNEIEFKLDASQFKLNPQPLVVVDELQPDVLDFIYRHRIDDVYVKPMGLNTDIWKTTDASNYLRTSGFVKPSDVAVSVKNLDSLISYDISNLKDGDYIWTTFDDSVINQSQMVWNVYRFTRSNLQIIGAVKEGAFIRITCSRPVNLSSGMMIGIDDNIKLKGFHKVIAVSGNTFTIPENKIVLGSFEISTPILFYKLISQRFASIDDTIGSLDFRFKNSELVWVDQTSNNKSAIYKHSPVYKRGAIVNTDPMTNLKFGIGLAVNGSGNMSAVADIAGVAICEKVIGTGKWEVRQRLSRFEADSTFGESMLFSKDGNMLIITDTSLNKVYVYKRSESQYVLDTIISTSSPDKLSIAKLITGNYILVVGSSSTRVVKYWNSANWQDYSVLQVSSGITEQFGYDMSVTENASTLVISAPGSDSNSGKVYIYRFVNGQYISSSSEIIKLSVPNDAERFGETVSISKTGKYLAVGASRMDVDFIVNSGQVFVYSNINGSYVLLQKINSRQVDTNGEFGSIVEFMNNDETLVILSRNGDFETITTFDGTLTTLDNDSLKFIEILADVGRVDIYDRYDTKFIYGETLENITISSAEYGKTMVVGDNTILISAIGSSDSFYENSGQVYSYEKPFDKFSWNLDSEQQYAIDVRTIKKAFLYNTITNKIVHNLDVVDQSQGKIPGIADQEIKYKTYFDPAVYSVGISNLTIDGGMNWDNKQVGMLWWDLTTAKFINVQLGDLSYKSANWNRLIDSASIDVYEWVSSNLKPLAWAQLADTADGLVRGISGIPKYGNDVYSVRRKYDSISQSFKETYFFWVKNKKTLPNVSGRMLPCLDVANLIADPVGYGYSCISFLDTNCINLVNSAKFLEDDNVALSIQYWIAENQEANYHTDWKLLSANRSTAIPRYLENKWFDSLIGIDSQNRMVPDLLLPIKHRYGIENRPRQSMFVNRSEALKQFIERINAVLSSTLLIDSYDLSKLHSFDAAPSKVSALWDLQIDTDAELRFINTSLARTASMSPVIEDGRIVDISLISGGYGYGALIETDTAGLWYGPDVVVSGTGTGARIKTLINISGTIVGTEIVDSGNGYEDDALTTVRDFAVLVTNDSTLSGKWAIYTIINGKWTVLLMQSYDVSKYWKYKDWYADGYTEYTKVDYLFENTYELVTSDIPISSLVRIKNIGSGGWMLLEKINNAKTIEYTENFSVVGRESGTIEFLNSLYLPEQGYDNILYSSLLYDTVPTTELRIILNALRDSILVDTLRVVYLNSFFASIRYVLSEQIFVDWVMKTSFVKASHNLGPLTKKVNYNSDNLTYYEEFINEVKPYRSKIREFVSNYNKIELSGTSVSDFDILPIITDDYKVDPVSIAITDSGSIVSSKDLKLNPWKNWNDNVGFDIVDIKVTNTGGNYITAPSVKIIGVQLPGGEPAVANAYITNGKVTRISLVSGGSRWISAPNVELVGGGSSSIIPARAVAIIGNSVIRSNYIKVRFDRTSKFYEVTELNVSETFTGTAVTSTKVIFPLKWSPDIRLTKSAVSINGIELLRNEYSLKTVSKFNGEYTQYSGLLTLKNTVDAGSTIIVDYYKNFDHLNAVDRINFYYNPTSGQYGKDLSQLMTGIDYGGVTVSGIDFGNPTGWDTAPWATAWDNDASFEDYTTFLLTTTDKIVLPFTPEDGDLINVYVSRYVNGSYGPAVRIDDIAYPSDLTLSDTILMTTFVGDGIVNTIPLPAGLNPNNGDKIICRKSDSDGSYNTASDVDTLISGGDLSYYSALGISPDEIVIDGSSELVTSVTSSAPEEMVAGQIMDTMALKVYTRPTSGSPNILFRNYVSSSQDTRFKIGQYFLNDSSVVVMINGAVTDAYEIDYQNNEVVFDSIPTVGSKISILSISFSSKNVLDMNYFISDGETLEYVTKANWVPGLTSTVIVNGEVQQYELFKTDTSYSNVTGQSWRSKVGIRFLTPPDVGSLINYILDTSNIDNSASIVKTEVLTIAPTISEYQLSNIVGVNPPKSANVIVKTENKILVPPSVEYFVLTDNTLTYGLSNLKYMNSNLISSDIKVSIGQRVLRSMIDYTIEFNYYPISYTMNSVGTISESTGYLLGDILELTPTGVIRPATFEVTGITNGSITELTIIDGGNYITALSGNLTLTGGTGIGVTITANFILDTNVAPAVAVKLQPSVYKEGSKMAVEVLRSADYEIADNSIKFNVSLAVGTVVEVVSFYNHNILEVERSVDKLVPVSAITNGTTEFYELTDKTMGHFKFSKTVVSSDFIWVIKNGVLLSNRIDYILEPNFTSIKFNFMLNPTDIVQVMAFTNTTVTDSFGFMQFKDMLNRVHYKRLNKAKTTTLIKELLQTDSSIDVVNATTLDVPIPQYNIPGIIEINGERIEYFIKDGNSLKQLRRGTLGTGIPNTHPVGTVVQCIGASETIPYKDKVLIKKCSFESTPVVYQTGIVELPFTPSINNIDVFVGGKRLKKTSFVLHGAILNNSGVIIDSTHPYSTAGDIILPPEFTITNDFKLKLTRVPDKSVSVVIVKKQGKVWNDTNTRLVNSQNNIAEFVKSAETIWPK